MCVKEVVKVTFVCGCFYPNMKFTGHCTSRCPAYYRDGRCREELYDIVSTSTPSSICPKCRGGSDPARPVPRSPVYRYRSPSPASRPPPPAPSPPPAYPRYGSPSPRYRYRSPSPPPPPAPSYRINRLPPLLLGIAPRLLRLLGIVLAAVLVLVHVIGAVGAAAAERCLPRYFTC